MSQRAKKENRLQKAGYTTRKGQFGAFKMRGGVQYEYYIIKVVSTKKEVITIQYRDEDNYSYIYVFSYNPNRTYNINLIKSKIKITYEEKKYIIIELTPSEVSPVEEYFCNIISQSEYRVTKIVQNTTNKSKIPNNSKWEFKKNENNENNEIVRLNNSSTFSMKLINEKIDMIVFNSNKGMNGHIDMNGNIDMRTRLKEHISIISNLMDILYYQRDPLFFYYNYLIGHLARNKNK